MDEVGAIRIPWEFVRDPDTYHTVLMADVGGVIRFGYDFGHPHSHFPGHEVWRLPLRLDSEAIETIIKSRLGRRMTVDMLWLSNELLQVFVESQKEKQNGENRVSDSGTAAEGQEGPRAS